MDISRVKIMRDFGLNSKVKRIQNELKVQSRKTTQRDKKKDSPEV